MAFASSVSGKTITGNKSRVWGTFTNTDLDTGGNIASSVHGLDNIETAVVEVTSHIGATMPRKFINSTSAGVTTQGTLGILCDNGVDGTWEVTGI